MGNNTGWGNYFPIGIVLFECPKAKHRNRVPFNAGAAIEAHIG